MRMVNLVNDQDEIIGQTDLLDAHRGEGKKHQAVSLFLFHQNTSGDFDLLLQQRSQEKIVGALNWANTLCANLMPGENHFQCLKRRMLEELGITWQETWMLEKAIIFNYQVKCENGFSENEIDHIFVSVLDNEQFDSLVIKANREEVANYKWFSWSKLKVKEFEKLEISPWTALFLSDSKIIKQIEEVLNKWQKLNQ